VRVKLHGFKISELDGYEWWTGPHPLRVLSIYIGGKINHQGWAGSGDEERK
jgi:hypothetical protein